MTTPSIPIKGFTVAIAIDNGEGRSGGEPGGQILLGLSNVPGHVRLAAIERWGSGSDEKSEALLILSRDETEAVIKALHAELARMDGL